jgi:hypothetical protein
VKDDGLTKIFMQNLLKWDWQPIETNISRGIPDLNGCCLATSVWIEMKRADHWMANDIKPEQVAWAERRLRHGGLVFLAVRRAKAELWLYSGWDTRKLMTQRLDAVKPLGWWTGTPARWNWDEVSAILTDRQP